MWVVLDIGEEEGFIDDYIYYFSFAICLYFHMFTGRAGVEMVCYEEESFICRCLEELDLVLFSGHLFCSFLSNPQ